MDTTLSPFKIFSGTKSRYMAEEICKELGVELGSMKIEHFADGEFEVCFEESVRGCEVYLVQSTFPNCDNLMELLLMIDAAKRASAKSVIAVMPYFGWARQDRKDKPRVSIAAKLVSDMLVTAGVDRVITMDLHADQIQGFFNVPVDHLYAKYLDVPLVLCHKQRAKANVVAKMTVIGDVQDKNVILVDDMVDTAGTITKAADLMMENGAKSVRALASHAIMSDPATQRVNDSGLTEMIFTNSIPYTKDCPKCTIISVARLFADTIRRVHCNQSISSQYIIK